MGRVIACSFIIILLFVCADCESQNNISRIEYNSGARTFREQVIITPDSLVSITQNFRTDSGPVVKKRALTSEEWKNVISTLSNVKPEEIGQLKSPTDKRTYDAASHSSLIITTSPGHSFSHGFDDIDPHEKLKPLMRAVLELR